MLELIGPHTYVTCARLLVGGDDTADGVPSDFGDSLFRLLARTDVLRAAGAAAAAVAAAFALLALLLLLFVVLTVDMRLILLWLCTLLAVPAAFAPLFAPAGGYSCGSVGGERTPAEHAHKHTHK